MRDLECPMRGRRCPELASGEFDAFLQSTIELQGLEFSLAHCRELTPQDRRCA